jgi:hypothetical protein
MGTPAPGGRRVGGYDGASARTDGGTHLRTRPLSAAAAAAIALALPLTACTGSSNDGASDASSTSPSITSTPSPGGATFTGHGVSFSYPKRWKELTLSDSSASTGSVEWEETVGIDGRNVVSLARYTLVTSITDANIDARARSIGSQIESLFTQAGGSLTDGPTSGQMAGFPALSFAGTVKTPTGRTVNTRLTLAFDGTREYAVTCQYDDRSRAEIESGCDRVTSTLAVTG